MKAGIIVVGAGAAGLMTARELAKAGRRVIVLEARDRLGGRILPLDPQEFGYPAQAGAEFAHGASPVTHELAKEAGVTLIPAEGDMWYSANGKITANGNRIPHQDLLNAKLKTLECDMSLAEFFGKYFSGDEFAGLRAAAADMAEGYDAADPARVSTFALRDEWLGGEDWIQFRIKEGYGALIDFLAADIKKHGGEICFGTRVEKISLGNGGVRTLCADGKAYEAEKVIVTVPLPLIKGIAFDPPIREKLAAAEKIGYGNAIKITFRFKTRWWVHALDRDFSEMDFMISDQPVGVWWTENPNPVLVGWMGGPKTAAFRDKTPELITEAALASLASIFRTEEEFLKSELVAARATDWVRDPFARGAYSYPTPETAAAQAELARPVRDALFFAGEALYEGKDTATVEGAFASGRDTARKILGQ